MSVPEVRGRESYWPARPGHHGSPHPIATAASSSKGRARPSRGPRVSRAGVAYRSPFGSIAWRAPGCVPSMTRRRAVSRPGTWLPRTRPSIVALTTPWRLELGDRPAVRVVAHEGVPQRGSGGQRDRRSLGGGSSVAVAIQTPHRRDGRRPAPGSRTWRGRGIVRGPVLTRLAAAATLPIEDCQLGGQIGSGPCPCCRQDVADEECSLRRDRCLPAGSWPSRRRDRRGRRPRGSSGRQAHAAIRDRP